MAVMVGTGDFTYEALPSWQKLPDGVTLIETPGVAVNSQDHVYAITRNTDHPVMVFNRDGTFITSFGKGIFSQRTHGILIGPDDAVYCADDGTHTITKFSPEGKLLMTIGTPYQPAQKWGGQPFNRPTHCAVSPVSGNLYISDGYGNSRVHKYTADGRHLLSWGSPGIDAGQFIRPHNVVVDDQERVYIADRECHRVQVFDGDGKFITMWSNIHRPDGMVRGPDGNIYIGELNGIPGVDDAPGLGHRVSILSPRGELLARFGDPVEGEAPGQFIAPHGIAVDSHGDIYVGEVSFTIRGSKMDPPRELRSLCKLRRVR
ncbi:MAG TPA: peptidyl-alpha-hydroxyglycine alpha-amidating lyase family protein [Dehalococcoidia bacterium]|nr:peptidyl-alpha-hydroxyglycine alpha-amidating lyase family protein [Dehalococcoidia bacterium]